MMVRMMFFILMLACFCACSQETKEPSAKEKSTQESIPDYTSEMKNYGIANDTINVLGGLKLDVPAPNFKLQGTDNRIFRLRRELKKGPVVILFYRGEWCPYCNKNLSEIAAGIEKIKAKGASVVAISLETKDNALLTLDKTSASFPILRDPAKLTSRAYKVLFKVDETYNQMIGTSLGADIAKSNADVLKTPYLVVPATYIVGKSGFIEYVHYDINYKSRATLQDILDNIPE